MYTILLQEGIHHGEDIVCLSLQIKVNIENNPYRLVHAMINYMHEAEDILSQAPTPVRDQMEKYMTEYEINDSSLTGDIRPWGGFFHLKVTPEYDQKLLWVNAVSSNDGYEQIASGINALSTQYHGSPDVPGHDETWEALTDIVLIKGKTDLSALEGKELEKAKSREVAEGLEVFYVRAGGDIQIRAGSMHALLNPFTDKIIMMRETRTSKVPQSADIREANNYRVLDQTRRDGAPDYYPWMIEQIQKFVAAVKSDPIYQNQTVCSLPMRASR